MRLPSPSDHNAGGFGFPPFAVDLVGHQDDRGLGTAQHLGDRFVGRGGADGRIDHDDDRVRGLHRELRLRRDGLLQTLRIGLPATGVDDGEPPARPARRVRHRSRVTPGMSLDNGFPAPEDAVDECRLADVRPPDDGDHRHQSPVPSSSPSTRSLISQSVSSDHVPSPATVRPVSMLSVTAVLRSARRPGEPVRRVPGRG